MRNEFSNVNSEEKVYYSIDAIAEHYGLAPWTIRMWVNRFDQLDYILDTDGNILFSPHAVEQIGEICRLKKKRMKIEEVRKYLNSGNATKDSDPEYDETKSGMSDEYGKER